jgi:hypothetical protein
LGDLLNWELFCAIFFWFCSTTLKKTIRLPMFTSEGKLRAPLWIHARFIYPSSDLARAKG